jgi:hypothetical protein
MGFLAIARSLGRHLLHHWQHHWLRHFHHAHLHPQQCVLRWRLTAHLGGRRCDCHFGGILLRRAGHQHPKVGRRLRLPLPHAMVSLNQQFLAHIARISSLCYRRTAVAFSFMTCACIFTNPGTMAIQMETFSEYVIQGLKVLRPRITSSTNNHAFQIEFCSSSTRFLVNKLISFSVICMPLPLNYSHSLTHSFSVASLPQLLLCPCRRRPLPNGGHGGQSCGLGNHCDCRLSCLDDQRSLNLNNSRTNLPQ